MAIGAPYRDIPAGVNPYVDPGKPNVGQVHVVYGSPSGLNGAGAPAPQTLNQPSPVQAGAIFGAALASGDFNGDGYSDLAVSAPYYDNPGYPENYVDAGRIFFFYGSANGLVSDFNYILIEVSNAHLGTALAWGRFDADGYGDLAIGTPNFSGRSGRVDVVYANPNGHGMRSLAPDRFEGFVQGQDGVEGAAEYGDLFGASLAGGDFDRDGQTDLAIGAPGEDIGSVADAGAVNVIYSAGAAGLSTDGDQLWSQDQAGVEGTSEAGDLFGASLAAVGGGGRDLAVGVPGEDVGSVQNAGAVQVIYHSSAAGGLDAAGDQFWSQDAPEVEGASEAGDMYGFSLAGGDFDGDGVRDLAVGVPGEDIGSIQDAGAVSVIYHGATGLSATAGPGDQFWSQDSPDVLDQAEQGDEFGRVLSAWDFNPDVFNPFATGAADLAVGVPKEDVGSLADAGAVNVIYASVPESKGSLHLRNVGNQLLLRSTLAGSLAAGDWFGGALY